MPRRLASFIVWALMLTGLSLVMTNAGMAEELGVRNLGGRPKFQNSKFETPKPAYAPKPCKKQGSIDEKGEPTCFILYDAKAEEDAVQGDSLRKPGGKVTGPRASRNPFDWLTASSVRRGEVGLRLIGQRGLVRTPDGRFDMAVSPRTDVMLKMNLRFNTMRKPKPSFPE